MRFRAVRELASGFARGWVSVVAVVIIAMIVSYAAGAVTVVVAVDGESGGRVAAAPVVSTVTVTTVAPEAWEEDTLPDEMYRWVADHPGADLRGPDRADRLSAGRDGCWYASAQDGKSGLLMCPGPENYRIDW
jgi:hypothetical protein